MKNGPTPGEIEIRAVTESDAGTLWALRLHALTQDPQAFGESAGEHRQTSPAVYAERLRNGGADNFVIGAFAGSALVGMAGFFREQQEKRRHRGQVWGVFVMPEYRGRGVGRALLEHLLEKALTLPKLNCIALTVTASQSTARQLYLNLGFRPFGIEPRALIVNGIAVDEEHMQLEINR